MEKAAPENVCVKKEPNSKGLKCKFSSGRETEGKNIPGLGLFNALLMMLRFAAKQRRFLFLQQNLSVK